MDLKDLVPQKASFTLSKTDKQYWLKPFTLADESWMAQRYGDQVEQVFKKVKLKEISEIVFHIMEEESKRDFIQQEVTFIDDEGVETKRKVGGAELFRHFVQTQDEKLSLLHALLQTIGFSRPMLDELEAEEAQKADELKKKIDPPTRSAFEPLVGPQ